MDYSIAIYKMVSEIQRTKSGKQFVKYFDTNTKEEEKNNLAIKLGFSTKGDFDSHLKKIYSNKIIILQKFPQLESISNSQSVVEEASKKVVINILKPNPHTSSDCWDLFYALLLSCSAGCGLGNDYDYCLAVCYGSASMVAFACWETAL